MTDEERIEQLSAEIREPESENPGGEEMPRVVFTRRRLLLSLIFVISTVAFLYFVLPKLLGLQETWNRIRQGNVWWLGLAVGLELLLVRQLRGAVPGRVCPRAVADRSGARATRSRWLGWRRRVCSRPAALAGSR